MVILKDHGNDIDISGKVVALEYEDGIPQNCTITLNAKNGRYETLDPIIQKWDRLYVEITDKRINTVRDVFHVKIRKKVSKPGQVPKLILICPHQSSNLWGRTISLPARRQSGHSALESIVRILNENKGDKDPTVESPPFDPVTKAGNRLDPNTANDYIFEAVKLKQASDEIVRIELNPVEGGGSFEPMFVRFKSKYNHAAGTDLDVVYLQAFEQGYTAREGTFGNIPKITLRHDFLNFAERPNVLNFDSNLETEKGTNLIAIGAKKAGTYPVDFSKYFSALEVFNSAKGWETGVTYRAGTLVQLAGVKYECVIEHMSSVGLRPRTPSATWRERDFTMPDHWETGRAYALAHIIRDNNIAYRALAAHTSSNTNRPPGPNWVRIAYVPTTEYSPLTKDKAQYWINALGGGKHAGTNNLRTVMVDPNVIIKHRDHPRTWVDRVTNDPTDIPAEEKLDGDKFVHTYRVLAIQPATGLPTVTGDFVGNDRNGLLMAGRVVEWDDPDGDGVGEWVVLDYIRTEDDQEIYEWNEDLSWTKNPLENGGFIIGDADMGGSRTNAWRKGAYVISEVSFFNGIWNLLTGDGLSQVLSGDFSSFSGKKFASFVPDRSFDCVHAPRFNTTAGHIVCGNEGIQPQDNSDRSAVFIESSPIALTGKFSQYIGLNFAFPWPRTSNAIPYGAVAIGERIRTVPFDFLNMDYSHTHNREWFGQNAEDYFPIQSFAFIENFLAEFTLFGVPEIGEDYSMGIWLADRFDNVVILDYNHDRNADSIPKDVNIANKEYYFAVPGTSAFLSAAEPEQFKVFDERSCVRGGLFSRDSFDNQGRFLGIRSRFKVISRLKLSIDAFRMIKPLVATNVDSFTKPERNIEPQKIQMGNITHYNQLKHFVLGLERFYNFIRDSYTVHTTGRCDIDFGDPIYLRLPQALDETTNSLDNTIRVVAEKITYSISKPKKGPGGFTRDVHVATRLYPEELP